MPSKHMTSRQQAIVRILTAMAGNPVTIGAVSEKLGVSSRTVLRELPAIEAWMDENDFTFTRKPGVGLAIEEDAATIQLLNDLMKTQQSDSSYSQKERRRQILGELLFLREPVKSYVFLSRFQISEGTLARDLDALAGWLDAYKIQISRRPGAGIFLKGSETAYRQAIAGAALEFMGDGEILKLLRRSDDAGAPSYQPQEETAGSKLLKNRLYQFIEPQVITFVEQILSETEKKLDIRYTDSGYMALIVHLSLAIRRLRCGEKIEMDPLELQSLAKLPEFAVASQIAGKISSKFQLEIPAEETGFITMHLSSARIWPRSGRPRSQLQTINTRQIVLAIVESVEQQLGLSFHTCTQMIEELTSHMDSMISRLSMNIHLENSQGDTIRQKYPAIYQAVEHACSLLRERLFIENISASEITFVTMHFAAAAETLRAEQKQVAVAVVCPSGMGASRMLAANLMRSLHNVEIRQIMSAFHLDPEKLRENGIDLIISTVPLDLDFPSICVSPIPQAQDMLVITNAVESIGADRAKKSLTKPLLPDTGNEMTWEDIRSFTRTGEEISQLLEHFRIQEIPAIQGPENLLGLAAGIFAETILERQITGQDLARREEVQNTFIPELGIYLLHCRTKAVRHCRFGFLLLKETFATENGTVRGAILLLAPQSEWNECIEVISRISVLLAEEPDFLAALLRGDRDTSRRLMEKALVRFFQNKLLNRKGEETL